MRDLPTDFRLAIGRVARRLRQLYAEPRNGESPISFLELAVLSSLERKGPTSPGRLAGDERVTAPAIAAALRSLEADSRVIRRQNADDGRRVVVELTQAGRRTLRDHDQTVTGRIKQVLDAELSEDERRMLMVVIPLLERVADRL